AMTITGGSSLPKDEIDRMMREAEQHAEEDRKRREEAEVRNQAETLVYQTEKFVKENDEKLPGDVKDSVNAALGEAQTALKGTDGAEHGDGERVVVRDRRRIDPVTGEVRVPAGQPAGAGPEAPEQPAEQVAGPDAVAAAELASQVAERTADLQRVSAEYANYR